MHVEESFQLFRDIKTEIGQIVIGQEEMIDVMICTFFAGGHILLEGVPGLAKSLAVETFAKVVGGSFHRFQFTPDKMPGDITGTTVYNEHEKKFDFHPGPIFCNIFLADEINRASPKVQSALLEAMQERRIDMECIRYDIAPPFMVLATQNPIEQVGTYPLAEAQVDRFMVKYDVGYPAREDELELIRRKHTDFEERRQRIRTLISPEEILGLQLAIRTKVSVSQTVIRYLYEICSATRPNEDPNRDSARKRVHELIRLGASPRALEYLLGLSKTYAFFNGRAYVSFKDVNTCSFHVLRHRILLSNYALVEKITPDAIIGWILQTVSPY
jgi:MoxR-like ATPase